MRKKGRCKRLLLSGQYWNVPTPEGVVQANCEVWLNVEVRLDTQDNDDSPRSESGGDDLLGGKLEELCNRIGDIFQIAKKATPSEARVVQIELFEGLGETPKADA